MATFDSVLAMHEAAPIDDEPVTDDDRRHIEEGWQAYRTGHVASAEDIRQMLYEDEFNRNHETE